MRKSILFVVLCIPAIAVGQVKNSKDSLTQEANQVTDPQQLLRVFDELIYQWAEDNFDSAYSYSKKMYDLALQQNDPVWIAKALLQLGLPHDYHNHIDSARYYYQKSRDFAEAHHDKIGIANAAFNLATLYYMTGNYLTAINKYVEVEKMFTELNDDKRLARLYNNLGVIYRKTEQFSSSIEAFKNSLAIKKKQNDPKGIINTSINLSTLQMFTLDFEGAEAISLEALDLSRSTKNQGAEITVLINLGIIYSKEQNKVSRNLEKALRFLLQASWLITESSALKDRIECWMNLAGTYQAMGNLAQTKLYLNKIEPLLDKISPDGLISYYELRAGESISTGNYKGALDFYKKQTEAQEKLTGIKLKERTKELEILHETEKKEAEISQLELAREKDAIELSRNATQRNLSIAISLGLLSIVGLIYYQYISKQKINRQLTEKNITIEKSLIEREALLKEIHHRVKNNLQIISSLLSLQSKSMDDTAAQGAIAESRNRVKSMSLIHEQLYQDNIISGVEISDYIQRLVGSLTASYGLDTDRVEIKVEADQLLLDVDSAIPLGLIINELVSNSIKYAFPEEKSGTIVISLKEMKGELHLQVKDNGVGIDLESKSKQSFGLSMVNSLMRKLKAEMKIMNEAGTSVELVIKDFKKVTFV